MQSKRSASISDFILMRSVLPFLSCQLNFDDGWPGGACGQAHAENMLGGLIACDDCSQARGHETPVAALTIKQLPLAGEPRYHANAWTSTEA